MAPNAGQQFVFTRDAQIADLRAYALQYVDFDIENELAFERLSLVQEEIVDLRASYKSTTDALVKLGNADVANHLDILNEFLDLLSKINLKLKTHGRAASPTDDMIIPEETVPCNRASDMLSFRLPEIPIPTFAGEFAEWLTFRDTFTNIFSENPRLSDSVKFYYLKQSLSGEAANRISNIPPGNNNFTIAWNLLVERYDNPRLIAAAHISGLKRPPEIVKNSSASLRAFIDSCKSHITALETLQMDVEVKDLLFAYEILSHLDLQTRREWEQKQSIMRNPKIKDLWEFLENRCKVWEIVNQSSSQADTLLLKPVVKSVGNKTIQPQTSAQPKTKHYNNLSSSCSFCKENHSIFKCSTFINFSPAERLTAAKRHQLCFNCLRENTPQHPCSSSSCFMCHRKHHSLLHNSFNSQQNVSNLKPTTNIVRSDGAATNRQSASPNQGLMSSACNYVEASTPLGSSTSYQSTHGTRVSTSEAYPNINQPFNHCYTGDRYIPTAVPPIDVSSSLCMPNNSSLRQSSDTEPNFAQAQYPATAAGTQSTSFTAANSVGSSSMLPTAQVFVTTSAGNTLACTCLLDTGSDANLISQSLANHLGLPQEQSTVRIQGISDASLVSTSSVNLTVTSLSQTWSFNSGYLIVPRITSNLPRFTFDARAIQVPGNMPLADPHFNQSKPIDLLIGSAAFSTLLLAGVVSLGPNQPILLSTKLGWILFGAMPNPLDCAHPEATVNFLCTDQVQGQLENFWRLEHIADKPLLTPDEQFVEKHFQQHVSRTDSGRYTVSLPRKPNFNTLGGTASSALKRFYSLERRLSKDDDLKTQYIDFMAEYEALGHMAPVPRAELDRPSYYIPHHPIFKPDSTTTRLRVVFDASAKSNTLVSLNDVLHTGPTVQPDLFDVVLRFRTHLVAFIADITKMYRQILIDPIDQDYQRIYWRKDPSLPVQSYRLLTATYGTAPAAFLATRTLLQLAQDETPHLPEVFRPLTQDFYVDDILSGSSTVQAAAQLAQQLLSTLYKGGFELRKWLSNSSQVMQSVPEELHQSHVTTTLIDSDENSSKTLGLSWNATHDELTIASDVSHLLTKGSFTKREFLSAVASIFDPLGLISPVVIRPKILFQQLWLQKLGWDDPLPKPLLTQWLEILNQLPEISNIRIPRCAFTSAEKSQLQLHGFCDASVQAYGACVYIRSSVSGQPPISRLLSSKSRVAPLKPLSIPRLELCAALLLSRLVNKVLQAITYSMSEVHLWTDSANVCAWLKAPPNRKDVFVALRVSEIQENTSSFAWHHVKSAENPADLISRGSLPVALRSNNLWWNGPSWLSLSLIPDEIFNSVVNVSVSSSATACPITVQQPSPCSTIVERCSTYSKMLRVLAFCLRFTHNCRFSASRRSGAISISELRSAELLLVKHVQSESFPDEIKSLQSSRALPLKSSLLPLAPFLHSDGLLRVGGRLSQSQLPFDFKHQILLPHKHKFTKVLILSVHLRLLHAGAQSVLADIRTRFWFVSSRRTVRDVLRKCIACFKFHPTATQQQMGQLPPSRFSTVHPFVNCGTDYAGPITIKVGGPRSRVTCKAYLVLFICMATKAVHCEVASDLTTKAFIAALSRFVARRGLPSAIFSDNASNFQGASNELSALYAFLNNSKTQTTIQNASSRLRIQWHFIPPRAPHFGGLWETAIKSFKSVFRVCSSNQILTLEEIITLSIQIEAILNSRPLVPLTEDPDDFNYLSPGHFLIGRPPSALPNPELPDQKISLLKRWQRLQHLSGQLWDRWSTDYLATLQRRNKWHSSANNISENTVVLLKEDHLPLGSWKLGRIVETFPGLDGKVRVVSVRTAQGVFKRSILRTIPLPVSDW